MKEEYPKKIDPVLRDVKPIRPRGAEQSPLRGRQDKQVQPKPPRPRKLRKIWFPRRMVRPLFILGLAALVLVVSVSSARFLFQDDELGRASFGELRNLVGSLVAVSSDLNKLKAEGLNFAFNGRGEELIAVLKSLQGNVAKLNALGIGFIDRDTLATASEGLDALIALLDRPGEQRFLVLFLNPSEMRPIGGFAGSYGEVVLTRGSIKEIKVNDIYYPDRFLGKKIVPPRELQSVTADWGARDAAWFFDFPASAEKTIELLESSEIYSRDDIKFEGVIALNVRVIEDILEITGPINLAEYNLTLTKDNFLEEIQKEVEDGRDKKPGENPKRVLSALTPLLTARLNQLNDSDKSALAFALLARAMNKDIQFYFDEPQTQEFVEKVGWAGRVATLPSDFNGDYLAVVNTNIAGGKTDAVVTQAIQLKSEIDLQGRVNNHLVIRRSHLGEKKTAPWYRTKNQNFIKVFTVPNAELISLTGVTPKEIKPRLNYAAAGYSVDLLLGALESTRKENRKFSTEIYMESGKQAFGSWFSILPGETKNLEMSYIGESIPLIAGTQYRFILDKQSGVESAFEYEIVSPPGYKWQETNGSTFAYKNDTIPARLELKLTLIRN